MKGHGIPESMRQGVRDVARRFFGLPYEEKLKIKLSPSTGLRGYQGIGENLTGGNHDKQEAIDLYKVVEPGTYGALGAAFEGPNLWPENPADFRPLVEEYISAIKEVSKNIVRGIALALGGSPYTFEGERAGDTFWAVRLLSYPGSTKKMLENGIGCGAHTDYGLLTMINQDDDIPALQAMNKSGEWLRAFPVPGTFFCTTGRMLMAYTNGIYETAFHRVINNSPNCRISIPFFYEPNFDAVVEPLDFCKDRTGGVAKFEPEMYGDYLVRKIHASFGMKY